MTKINRISIHGFKSFAYKTDIPFSEKFNCILGPNGSGKSNIGDSLCFVLGRLSAKSMRAEKAANLIFNGGKNKKPAAAGTVEIEFCNEQKTFPLEEPSVVLSRTITKKGNSIYRVNGKKKTRTEVLDLLSLARINPEGYNIILQGDITRFVTMSPLERRKIIEEISDVSIYEEKKHKAMLELNKVEDKLNSATIILKERGTHLKELKKDRDQALKFKEIKDKIDSHKATFLHLQIEDKLQEKGKFDAEVEKHQARISKAEEMLQKLKQMVEDTRQEISTINKEIEQKGEKEQVRVHKEIEDMKVSVVKDKSRISVLKDEISKLQQRKDQFREEIKELQQKSSSFNQKQASLTKTIQQKQREIAKLDQDIVQFKKKNKIESSQQLEQELEEKDKLIEQKQEEVQQIRHRQQELLREKDKLEYQLESIDEKIRKVKEIEQENKEQVKSLQAKKSEFKAATLKLNKCLDEDSSFASQMANARRKVAELQEQHAKTQARVASVQARLASNKATQSILSNKSKFKGVYGTVAELGQVKRKFAMALETAAGARMQQVVVDSDQTAAECIKYLKSNKLGSAAFIPLNKIKARGISTEDKKFVKQQGAHDFALNLVTFQAKYQKAFEYVFGNTLVVDDIDVARNIGIGKIKMATLDGALAEASGVMRGGFIAKQGGLGFKEKDSLEEIQKLESEISSAQQVITNIETKRGANEQEITFLRNKKAELEGEIITLEKTLHLNTGDLDASAALKKELQESLKKITNDVTVVQKQVTQINRELAELKSKKQMLRSHVNQLRDPRLLAQLRAFEEARQACREDVLRMESDLKNSSQHMEELLGPEEQKIRDIIKQHDKEEANFTAEIKQLSSALAGKEKQLLEKEKASKEFYAKYHQLFTWREKLNGMISKTENETENCREKMRTAERDLNLISLKNAEVKARLAGLQEEFKNFEGVDLLKNKDSQELQKELSKYEVMLTQMSAVNLKALEVYEQVEAEFNQLINKKNSLLSEKTDVLTMMNEIETKKKDHFMKTFKQAEENFQQIFANLFKKGKAFLQLDNPNDPFSDGLSIKVKISGNRFMDIKSLSGGEKTLTALSFIFAIQEYQPATFYILDEIDAALDKHNSEKLAKLVRTYSDKAQYIVISHNDSLISEADTLFGVSMTDGVSKVTSLHI